MTFVGTETIGFTVFVAQIVGLEAATVEVPITDVDDIDGPEDIVVAVITDGPEDIVGPETTMV